MQVMPHRRSWYELGLDGAVFLGQHPVGCGAGCRFGSDRLCHFALHGRRCDTAGGAGRFQRLWRVHPDRHSPVYPAGRCAGGQRPGGRRVPCPVAAVCPGPWRPVAHQYCGVHRLWRCQWFVHVGVCGGWCCGLPRVVSARLCAAAGGGHPGCWRHARSADTAQPVAADLRRPDRHLDRQTVSGRRAAWSVDGADLYGLRRVVGPAQPE